MMNDLFNDEHDVYNVTRLNREVRLLLENGFATLWVQAELSNFACPTSGHMYFSLKDANAQVRCAMFKNTNRLLTFVPANGMEVLVRANVGLYEGRGDFQLIVESMELAGEGELRRTYEALKQKLFKEGLFDAGHKQSLPLLPQTIGVITSPTGAAIRDILSTLERRYPIANVVVYPVKVQGNAAIKDILAMFEIIEERQECDVLIVARGGGSMEDLSIFNDEYLVRDIFACSVPIVSGIGHEVDFTIIDFVADARAATPTAAAELVSPSQGAVLQTILQQQNSLIQVVQARLTNFGTELMHLHKRLPHPIKQLQNNIQRLDDLATHLQYSMQSILTQKRDCLQSQLLAIHRCHPVQKLQHYLHQLQQLYRRLHQASECLWRNLDTRLKIATGALDALSPLATLSRGYAIVQRYDDVVVVQVQQLSVGDKVLASFADGHADCTVNAVCNAAKDKFS